MRILFSVPRYHPNHDGLVAGLQAAGHELHFLVRAGHATEFHRPGVAVTLLPGWDTGDNLRRPPPVRALARILAAVRPDVVVARNPSRTSLALHALCRLRGLPFLLYIQRRTGCETMGPGRRLLLRLGLWPAHTVNAICPDPPPPPPGKTCDFLPFAIEPGPVRTEWTERPPLSVLAVGKLDQARKNHRPLVRHLAPLLRGGDIRLTLLGLREEGTSPVFAALTEEIAAQGVGDRVRIRENLNYAASRRLYAEHDLLVLASSAERAAVSPMEALAAGIPVICGSDNGTNFVLREGETGYVFPDGDFPAMAARVADLVADPAAAARMGRAGRRLIETEFSPAAAARRFESILARHFPQLR